MITIRVTGWGVPCPINRRYLVESLMTKSPGTSYMDFEIPVAEVSPCLVKLVEFGFKFKIWGGN